MPPKSRAYIIASVALFALALVAGVHDDPTVAGLLVFSSAAAMILALLQPAAECGFCGRRIKMGRKLCYWCQQKFGGEQ